MSEVSTPIAYGARVRPAVRGPAAPRNAVLLVAITAVTSLADGVVRVALPLLASRVTSSPGLIAGVGFTLTLPWLLTAMHLGVLVDRSDRRRLLGLANVIRLAVIVALLSATSVGALSLPVIYAAGIGLGVAEVLALTSGAALVPSLVDKGHLPRTNAWVTGAETVCNELVGPSLGGLLLGLGVMVALSGPAAAYLASVLLVMLLVGTYRSPAPTLGEPALGEERRSVHADIAAGFRFLWSQKLLRTMVLMVAAMAACWSAWLALLPSFATARGPLHLSAGGYGLLLSALGAGGLVGALTARRVNRIVGRRGALMADLVGTFAMMAAPALTSSVWLVGATAFLGGAGGTLWTINSRTITQIAVPIEMMGRFSAISRLVGWGTLPMGAALAGAIAQFVGVRIAFALGAVGMALLFVPFLRTITPEVLRKAVDGDARSRGDADARSDGDLEVRSGSDEDVRFGSVADGHAQGR